MELRITVGGDPEGGWLVDVHDGDRQGVYRPDASHPTTADAAMGALCEHFPEFRQRLVRDAVVAAQIQANLDPPVEQWQDNAAPPDTSPAA